jgi:signal transduction histidine kinase
MTLAASIEVIEGRRDEMPDRARAAVDLLSSDVARFRTLVEDLLEISRFDAGAVHPNLDELLTAEFVTQAVAVSSLPDTPVVVEDRADNTLITGDRRRLARVIANLIDNARIHGGGSATVRVGIPAMDAEISRVRIEVSDSGPGVPEEERRLIFERFARGGGSGRRRDNDGAGLGLALVAEHVRLHSGSVWVEMGPEGLGSAFVIELPAEDLGDES